MNIGIDSDRRGDVTVIAARGDIDLGSVGALERAITAAMAAEEQTAVEVDLSGVTFVDSSGISALLKGRRAADAAGRGYRVVGADGLVLRVLELTGVWEHLHGHTS